MVFNLLFYILTLGCVLPLKYVYSLLPPYNDKYYMNLWEKLSYIPKMTIFRDIP